MKTKLLDYEYKYTGDQLAPHWIYKNFKMQGDAIVSFYGECDVRLTEMVDIEDVINSEPIYSKSMLSFIIEQFNIGLIEGVVRQRLFISIIKEALEKRINKAEHKIERRGDDIYIDDKKMSVSIATKSMTSVLIHTGINIISEGAAIKAIGLNDVGITDVKGLAEEIMKNYSEEIDDIVLATTKVNGR
jgi:hypothetical protein